MRSKTGFTLSIADPERATSLDSLNRNHKTRNPITKKLICLPFCKHTASHLMNGRAQHVDPRPHAPFIQNSSRACVRPLRLPHSYQTRLPLPREIAFGRWWQRCRDSLIWPQWRGTTAGKTGVHFSLFYMAFEGFCLACGGRRYRPSWVLAFISSAFWLRCVCPSVYLYCSCAYPIYELWDIFCVYARLHTYTLLHTLYFCVYIYTYIPALTYFTFLCTHLYIHTYTYKLYICVFTLLHTYLHTLTYFTFLCLHFYIHTYTLLHTLHFCVYTSIYIATHIYLFCICVHRSSHVSLRNKYEQLKITTSSFL